MKMNEIIKTVAGIVVASALAWVTIELAWIVSGQERTLPYYAQEAK